MPIYQQRLNQRTNFEGNRNFNKDAKDYCSPKRLSPLCPQVQQVREKTQKHSSTLLTCFLSQRRRHRCYWTMQTSHQDRTFQCA